MGQWIKIRKPEQSGEYLTYGDNGYNINYFSGKDWKIDDVKCWMKLQSPPEFKEKEKHSCNDCSHYKICMIANMADDDFVKENDCDNFTEKEKNIDLLGKQGYVLKWDFGAKKIVETSMCSVLYHILKNGKIEIHEKIICKSDLKKIGNLLFETKKQAKEKLEEYNNIAEEIKNTDDYKEHLEKHKKGKASGVELDEWGYIKRYIDGRYTKYGNLKEK